MTRITSVLATALLAAGLSTQAFAADMPTSGIFLDEDASRHDVQRVLGDLGFGSIKVIAQRGRVFDVVATWEGQKLDLRVHTGNSNSAGWGSITAK